MDHWFDAFTKQLAADRLSRRNFLSAGGIALAAVTSGMGWSNAWAQQPAAKRPGGGKTPVKEPEPMTIRFGPCTVNTRGLHFEHHRTSTVSVAGMTLTLEAVRTIDPNRMTVENTLLVNGKKEFEVTATSGASESQGKAQRGQAQPRTVKTSGPVTIHVWIGNAFGYQGADLTSDDGGKTFTGTIDGRAIRPFTPASGKKPEAVDGKPFSASLPAGFKAAFAELMKKSEQDLALCSSASPSPPLPITPKSTSTEAPLSFVTFNAFMSSGCTQCFNRCDPSNVSVGVNTFECFLLIFGSCGNLFGMSGKQSACHAACTFNDACHNVLCALPITASDARAGCDWSQICIGSTGYCCPKGFPNPCPGNFPPYLNNPLAGVNPEYVATWKNPEETQVCCAEDTACMKPPLWYTQLSAWAHGDQNYQGPPQPTPKVRLKTCCPRSQACGVEQKDAGWKHQGVWFGQCCEQGEICAISMDPVTLTKTVATGVPLPKTTSFDKPTCCAPQNVKNGKCCTRHWCGDSCCADEGHCKNGKCCPGTWCGDICCPNLEATCVNGKCCLGTPCGNVCCASGDKCINGKCSALCLTEQWTTDGKCCNTGTACGTKCCPSGCADAATSTCKGQKGTSKCVAPRVPCVSAMPGSNATEEICCGPKASCYDGKCCPPQKTVCMNKNTGKMGCWQPAMCMAQPK